MIAAILSWFAGRMAAPVAALLAVLFAASFVWQSARIEGVPFFGGGLKAQIAALEQQIATQALNAARTEAAALTARQQWQQAGQAQAGRQAVAQAHIETQIQTVIREVPKYVSRASNERCLVPWGAIRLLDAAASGADPAYVAAHVAPGQPDDAASDVDLSEAIAVLAANLGAARSNAGQLEHLEAALPP